MSNIHVPFEPGVQPLKIAFLGEAPSTEEEEVGRPLVGPAGRVFNALLQTANLNRADYWIGNVIDEKLPKNEIQNWCASTEEAKAAGWADFPCPASGHLRPEHRWHLDRLAAELAAAKPNVIVPLGGTALWALTGQADITAMRGAVSRATRAVSGAKLVPTFHPARVMREWKYFTIVVGDLLKAAREADKGPLVVYPRRRLLIEPNEEEVNRYVETKLLTADLLSVDIETGWGQITCIAFAPNSEEAICIPFFDHRKPNRSYWPNPDTEARVWGRVRDVLESPIPKLGQNFTYDVFWLLARKGIRTRNRTDDTRLLHHVLYSELPKDLEFLGASYTDQGPWKRMNDHKNDKRDD